MVPRQFGALLRRHRDSQIRFEFGAAIICNTINALAGNKTKVETFMPSWRGPKTTEPGWQEMRSRMMMASEFAGGTQ